MKADELMIGDYVLYQGHPNRVYRILPGTVPFADIGRAKEDLLHIVWNSGRNDVHDQVNVRDVEPIPLTPEILGKNGFKRDLVWHHCQRTFGEYIVGVQLGYANKIEFVEIRETGKDDVVPSEKTRLYLTHISYVHQFQHALRSCGIEKEIEL